MKIKLFPIFCVFAVLMTPSLFAAAVVLIDDDFSSSSTTNNSRIRTNQAGNGWIKNSSNEWTISGGALSNAGTTPGNFSTEGAVAIVFATDSLGANLSSLTLSFDYTVGSESTLKYGLMGYNENPYTSITNPGNELMNTGTGNGNVQNNTQSENDFADMSLLTGTDPGNSPGISLTGSGNFTQTYDLSSYAWSADEAADFASNPTSPGYSGSITGISDFEYVVLFFVNDATTALDPLNPDAAVSIDNVLISVVPEPSSMALLALGLTSLAFARRRKS